MPLETPCCRGFDSSPHAPWGLWTTYDDYKLPTANLRFMLYIIRVRNCYHMLGYPGNRVSDPKPVTLCTHLPLMLEPMEAALAQAWHCSWRPPWCRWIQTWANGQEWPQRELTSFALSSLPDVTTSPDPWPLRSHLGLTVNSSGEFYRFVWRCHHRKWGKSRANVAALSEMSLMKDGIQGSAKLAKLWVVILAPNAPVSKLPHLYISL